MVVLIEAANWPAVAETQALAAYDATHSTRLDDDAKAIHGPSFGSILRTARSQLQQQTSDLTTLLQNAALTARIAPTIFRGRGRTRTSRDFKPPRPEERVARSADLDF